MVYKHNNKYENENGIDLENICSKRKGKIKCLVYVIKH